MRTTTKAAIIATAVCAVALWASCGGIATAGGRSYTTRIINVAGAPMQISRAKAGIFDALDGESLATVNVCLAYKLPPKAVRRIRYRIAGLDASGKRAGVITLDDDGKPSTRSVADIIDAGDPRALGAYNGNLEPGNDRGYTKCWNIANTLDTKHVKTITVGVEGIVYADGSSWPAR